MHGAEHAPMKDAVTKVNHEYILERLFFFYFKEINQCLAAEYQAMCANKHLGETPSS